VCWLQPAPESNEHGLYLKRGSEGCSVVWVCNLVSHVQGRTYAEGVREQGAEGSMWAKREEVMGNWRELLSEELRYL
jgi:hypothetical protein